MKVIKEAVIGEYHFILDPEFFAITLDKDEKVLISREELTDLVGWLATEVALPQPKVPWQLVQDRPVYVNKFDIGPKVTCESHKDKAIDLANDPLEGRHATQTVPMHLGDPNLAYQATKGVKAVETVDLVLEASRAGATIHTKS